MSTLNLKPNHLLTVAAVLFAGYALYETFKKPGGAVSSQPGQAARDAGLQTFLNQQQAAYESAAVDEYDNITLPSNIGGVIE